jgi:hypothetical protein
MEENLNARWRSPAVTCTLMAKLLRLTWLPTGLAENTPRIYFTQHMVTFGGGEVGPSMREHISNNSIVFISSGLPVSPVSIATTTKKTKAELTIQLLAQP